MIALYWWRFRNENAIREGTVYFLFKVAAVNSGPFPYTI